MNKERYSIYDFPELLYDSKIFTNRQRCIILCLFSYLNLDGGGVYTIDILSEKTKIRKENIYRELKKLPFIQKEGKKISLNIEKLREFISAKLASAETVKMTPNNCQNDSKELSKRQLKTVKMTPNNCQNDSKELSKRQLKTVKMTLKKSSEEQEPQSLEQPLNNNFKKRVLNKSSRERILNESSRERVLNENFKIASSAEIASSAKNQQEEFFLEKEKLIRILEWSYEEFYRRTGSVLERNIERDEEDVQDILKALRPYSEKYQTSAAAIFRPLWQFFIDHYRKQRARGFQALKENLHEVYKWWMDDQIRCARERPRTRRLKDYHYWGFGDEACFGF